MAYTTTPANYVDYMYQLPENAMLKAIEVADAKINKINVDADNFEKYISNINALPNHKNIIDETVLNYRNKIDSVRQAIEKNPADYRKYLPDMRNISRSINSDKTLKSAQERYNEYQNWKKTNDELSAKNDLDNVLYNRIRSKIPDYISKSVFNPETQEFSSLNLPTGIPKTFDWNKANENYIKDMKPVIDASGSTISKDGKFLVETIEGRKHLSPKEIEQVWMNSFNSDTQAQNSYKWYYEQFGKDFADSIVQNAKESAMRKYRVSEGAKTKQTANPYGLLYAKENFKVAGDKLKRLHDLEDAERDRMDKIAELAGIYAASKDANAQPENVLEGIAAKEQAKRLGVDLDAVEKNIQKSNSLGNKPVLNTVADKITYNPFNGENKLDATKVTSKILSTKNEIDSLTNQMLELEKDPDLRNEYLNIKEDILNQQIALDNYNTIHKEATNTAIEALKKKGYTEEDLMFIKQPSLLNRVNMVYNSVIPKMYSGSGISEKNSDASLNFKEIKQLKDKAEKLFKDYNNELTNYYNKESKNTSINIDYVKFGEKDNNIIKEAISNNIWNINFIDPLTGNNLSKKTVKGKLPWGDKTSDVMLSFDKENPKSLINYLESKGKKLEDVIEVTGLSKPIPGHGVTATVKLNLEGSNVTSKNTYLMTLPSSLIMQLKNKINLNDPKQKEIFSTVIDRKKTNLLSDLESGFGDVDKLLGKYNKEGMKHIVPVEDPNTNRLYYMRVTPINIGNNIKYNVELSADGAYYKRKKIDGGYFNSLQDIVDNIYGKE